MKYYFRALGKYAEHDGRATRREFILYYVFHYLFVFVFSVLDGVLGLYPEDFILDYGVLTLLYLIATACPRICLSVRRLHDVGASGKWWWASNVPVLCFYVTYMYLKRSDSEPNEYGAPVDQKTSSAKQKENNSTHSRSSNKNLKKMYKKLNPALKNVVFPDGEKEFIYIGTMLNYKLPGQDLVKLFQIYASVYSYYSSSAGDVAKTYDYAKRKSAGVLTDDQALTMMSIVAVSTMDLQTYGADPVAAIEQYKEYAENLVQTVEISNANPDAIVATEAGADETENPIPDPGIRFCRACGAKLIGGSKFCHCCGGYIASVSEPKKERLAKDDNGFSTNKPARQLPTYTPPAAVSSPRKKSKAPVIITIILASVIILLAGILGGLTLYKNYQLEQEYEEQYAKVKQRMLEIDDWNYVTIDTLIRDLPEDYRDVSEIKTECNQISKYMTTIKNATYTEKGCEEFRKAYADLIVFNENNHDWDLSACIDSVYESSYGGLIFGKEWKDADSYHNFYWHIANDEELLITNLPSDRDDKKDYFFYSNHPLNPTKFGYENQNDTNDKFDAYEILDVYYKNGKWHMKIYCFSDSHTYLLE